MKKDKKTKKLSKKGLTILLSGIGVVIIVLASMNYFFTVGLRGYIDTFEKVKYDNQLVPYKDTNGFYTIKADRDIKILMLTDLHIGGGHYTARKDRKTIYEVATMVQKEKPDLVVLDGDNTFAVPGPVFNGGGTLDNKMVAKDVIRLFERLGVYYTTVFGNHDSEVFDYYSRDKIAKLYQDEKLKYCIMQQDFTDKGATKMHSVTNQCIQLKNEDGTIKKLLMLLDSNSYIDNSIKSVINWDYDTIHDSQIDWAKETILNLSKDKNNPVKSLFFFHIPIGEFQEAYMDLDKNGFKDTNDTKWVSGFWDEEMNETYNTRVWYGGISNLNVSPKDQDKLFETIGPDGINSLEGVFCGHDHVNTAVVNYRGVTLAYGNSLDNIAYSKVCESGLQRGSTVITVKKDGSWNEVHKNAYIDYGCSTDKYFKVYLDHLYYKNGVSKEYK